MKWIKHYVDATDSVKLNKLMDKYGVEGYGRYWLLLELLAQHWDENQERIEIHLRTIAKQLRYYKLTSAKEWVNNGQTMGLYEVDIDSNVFSFKAPILSELQSKDYKYEKTKRNKNDPKNKIKNKIKNKNKSESENTFDFEGLYKKYPRKRGKTKGLEICTSQIKTEKDFKLLEIAISNYTKEIEKAQTDINFVKQFGTFMRVWRDYLETDSLTVETLNPKAIYQAIASGATKLELVPDSYGLNEKDKLWISDNGGLKNLGKNTTDYTLKKMLGL